MQDNPTDFGYYTNPATGETEFFKGRLVVPPPKSLVGKPAGIYEAQGVKVAWTGVEAFILDGDPLVMRYPDAS